MKHLLLKTWLVMFCLLMLGGGNNAWAEDADYTLTPSAGSNNSYTGNCDVTVEGITWNVGGNAQQVPWRLGGKSISNVDRTVYSKTAYTSEVSKVDLTVGAASSITVNSLKLVYSTNEDFSNSSEISKTFSANSTISFEGDFPANAYYKFVFNVTVSGSSNKFVEFSKVEFYNSGAADTRTAVNMTGFSATSTTLVKGDNTTTTVTNDQNTWPASYTYESSNTKVATVSNDGVITAVAKGTARITATLDIANDDENWKKGATASKTIDITVNNPSHNYTFISNNTEVSSGSCEEGASITFPATNPEVADVVFKGWATAAIVGTQDDAPTFVNTATETMGTNDVTYYAVFAVKNTDSSTATGTGLSATTSAQTLEAGKPITYKSSAANSYSDPVRIYKNGTFTIAGATMTRIVLEGDDSSNPATNLVLKSGEPGSISTGTNTVTWTGSATSVTFVASSAQARVKKITATYGDATYSDYCTTVSLDPKPTIVLSATELAEYAGNTNTSITANVSEDAYTGALSVESSAEAVATASISEGTITINALTAGNATITVTAPAVTGFRKNTATIAVTVSNKLAHGLSFDAATLKLTVGDKEITEPTLSNPNSLPVVYSLEYATPANKDKVATIDPVTGKLTLADPSLSTETQGAVTVKASTVGDNSHAAGEVTYNLVVARKVTTTSWSNEGAAVNIDKDEIETLPTASNDGERNIQYESSNTEVATIDNTGAVTFVAYGTTTITAKTSATAEYAATSATYQLTFAPRYTVTFKVYGQVDVVLREETSGAGVVAPEVEPVNGKIFRGWAEATINGTTDVAPAFVSTATLDGDKTLYAVFATQNGVAETWNKVTDASTLAENDVIAIVSSEAVDYNIKGNATKYNGYIAMGKTQNNNNRAGVVVTVANDVLTINDDVQQITLTKATFNENTDWQLGVDGGYLYANNSSSNYLKTQETNDVDGLWNISITDGMATIYAKYSSYTRNYIRVNGNYANSTTTAPIVTAYKSDATTGVLASIYKKNGGITYSGYCTTVAPLELTLVAHAGETYYATFSSSSAVEFLDATVNTVTVDGNNMVVVEGANKQVPADNGVLISSTSNTVHYYVISSASALGDNYLKPAGDDGISKDAMAAANDNCKFYRLAYNNYTAQSGLGFYYGAADGDAFTCKAGTAYLAVPNGQAARGYSFDGEETAIESAIAEQLNTDVIFDLQGRRAKAGQHGIFIVNGKKVVR